MTSADPAAEGHDAARRRVAAKLEAARHVDLSRLIVGAPGPSVVGARRRAREAAAAASRADLLEEARRAATDWVLQAFAQRGYSGTWAATEMAVSVARPADRTAVVEALADAVTAAAVEDLVDAATIDELRATWDTLGASSTIPEPGALSDFTRSLAASGGRRGGAPSLAAGIGLLFVGVFGLGAEIPVGLAFLIAGAVVLTAGLRGRPS